LAASDHGRAGRAHRRDGAARLIAAARRARRPGLSRFSGFAVGAALETDAGTIVTGCNIENATYGLTMCAERVALFKALSDGHRAFRRIAIVADTASPTPPCGACRQLLWEFGGDLEVIMADLQQERARQPLRELLPLPFGAGLIATAGGRAGRAARRHPQGGRASPGRAKRR
jgi:cytidine deaminase